jgi:uncharacterized coiled-coil protein SlyX
MEQHQVSKPDDSFVGFPGSRSKVWLLSLVIALIGVAGLGVGYGLRQQGVISQMTAREADTSAAMMQMRSQLDSMTAKLNDMTAQQAAQVSAASVPSASRPA